MKKKKISTIYNFPYKITYIFAISDSSHYPCNFFFPKLSFKKPQGDYIVTNHFLKNDLDVTYIQNKQKQQKGKFFKRITIQQHNISTT